MKFILTIDWTFINVQEIIKISHESDDSIDSYFYLKNGEKYQIFESVNSFTIDECIYVFCEWCHMTMNKFVIDYITNFLSSEDTILDINQEDKSIWDEFTLFARDNIESLTVFKEEFLLPVN